MLKQLGTDVKVALLQDIFDSFFHDEKEWEAVEIADDCDIDNSATIAEGNAALGVLGVAEADLLTVEQLDRKLGTFIGDASDRCMGFLSKWRDPYNSNEWDEPGLFDAEHRVERGILPLNLRRHQKVGIAAMVRMFFSAKPGTPKSGVLLADDVGVGKTATTFGFMALLMLVVERQHSMGIPATQLLPTYLPDGHILGDFPFVNGGSSILLPVAPFIIRCPSTMLLVWYHELRTWFGPHTVDIFQYTVQTQDSFWLAWASSQQLAHRRIILVTHSVSLI